MFHKFIGFIGVVFMVLGTIVAVLGVPAFAGLVVWLTLFG